MYYLEYGLFLELRQSLNGTGCRKRKCYYGRNSAVLLQFSLYDSSFVNRRIWWNFRVGMKWCTYQKMCAGWQEGRTCLQVISLTNVLK